MIQRFILLFLLLIYGDYICNSQELQIKEKREFKLTQKDNGEFVRELIKITNYSTTGQILSNIDVCLDTNCCYYNKTFTQYERKRIYSYNNDNYMISEAFYYCNSLPCYKNFYKYEFDSKNRIIETRDYNYNYETDSKKYYKGQWVDAKIGDSTLHSITIKIFEYNDFDSISVEKILIKNIYPVSNKKSWSTKYKYDPNRNLIRVFTPFLGFIKFGNRHYYDNHNKLIKSVSNIPMSKSQVRFNYDEDEKITQVLEIVHKDTIVNSYKYGENKLVGIQINKNNRIFEYKYYYDSFDNLSKVEEYHDNDFFISNEFEYEYYQK